MDESEKARLDANLGPYAPVGALGTEQMRYVNNGYACRWAAAITANDMGCRITEGANGPGLAAALQLLTGKSQRVYRALLAVSEVCSYGPAALYNAEIGEFSDEIDFRTFFEALAPVIVSKLTSSATSAEVDMSDYFMDIVNGLSTMLTAIFISGLGDQLDEQAQSTEAIIMSTKIVNAIVSIANEVPVPENA